MPDFVTILGATGNIGMRAIDTLVAEGIHVRAVARSLDKIRNLRGIEPFPADVSDAAVLERAFSGASAAFVMIPPNVTAPDVRAEQNRVADSIIAAIQKSKLTHVVALSSVGAHRSEKMGPVNGIYDWEQKLTKLQGVNIQVLRPCYFMENLLVNVGLIKASGIMGSAIRGDARMAMIATRDIASAVAEALENRNFTGSSVRELLGQRDTTMTEVCAVVGRFLGKPDLKYVAFPYADARNAMTGMGLSADYARLIVEMCESINGGIFTPSQARDEKTTTPTSLEEFVEDVFVPAFTAS